MKAYSIFNIQLWKQKQKEVEDTDRKAEEERKAELVSTRTEIIISITRIKGRMSAEEQRTRREAETRRRTKARRDEGGNNTHIG